MKRKALSLTMGLIMALSVAAPAMAAEPSNFKTVGNTISVTMGTAAVDATFADAIDLKIKDGVQVSIPQTTSEKETKDTNVTDDTTTRYLVGTISKEDLTSIVNDLNYSQEKKEALFNKFDKSKEMQTQMDELYKQLIETPESTTIYTQIKELKEKAQSIFEEDILKKATEKGLLMEVEMSMAIPTSASNATYELIKE